MTVFMTDQPKTRFCPPVFNRESCGVLMERLFPLTFAFVGPRLSPRRLAFFSLHFFSSLFFALIPIVTDHAGALPPPFVVVNLEEPLFCIFFTEVTLEFASFSPR